MTRTSLGLNDKLDLITNKFMYDPIKKYFTVFIVILKTKTKTKNMDIYATLKISFVIKVNTRLCNIEPLIGYIFCQTELICKSVV